MPLPPQDLLQLALKAHRKGDIPAAERLYSKLLRQAPGDFNALNLLGVIRAQQRRFAEADRLLAKASEINASSEVLNNHGSVLIELGRYAEAIARLNRALLIKPGYAEAHFNLGNALRRSGQAEQAAESFRAAIRFRPGYVEAQQNLSAALRDLGRPAEAISALRQAVEINPRNAGLYNNLGVLLRDAGSLDEARQMFERAIALDPGMIDAYYYWVRSGKVPVNHDFLAALEAMEPRAGTLSRDGMATLHFALGKAYEDVGRYDDAFASLLKANRAARSSMEYDETRAREFFDRIRTIFTAPLMADKADRGSPSSLPIFIVGFPRSGTTLTEQILASHPNVHGAGEIGFVEELTGEAVVSDGGEIAFPESLPRLGAESLHRLGESYVERLGRTDPAAAHVTDKNLGNFGFLGFINLILPRAKIIHVQRDPFDTCLSCFSLRFAGNGSGFIYDLGELGRHYRMYQQMMDHWRQMLPPGAMLEVQYENIVENLEAEARRMVAYCGLAWDERCLAFHENERSVRTASVTQVRQRIYRSSVQRWRRYEKHLGPLADALGLSLTAAPRR